MHDSHFFSSKLQILYGFETVPDINKVKGLVQSADSQTSKLFRSNFVGMESQADHTKPQLPFPHAIILTLATPSRHNFIFGLVASCTGVVISSHYHFQRLIPISYLLEPRLNMWLNCDSKCLKRLDGFSLNSNHYYLKILVRLTELADLIHIYFCNSHIEI